MNLFLNKILKSLKKNERTQKDFTKCIFKQINDLHTTETLDGGG